MALSAGLGDRIVFLLRRILIKVSKDNASRKFKNQSKFCRETGSESRMNDNASGHKVVMELLILAITISLILALAPMRMRRSAEYM